MPIEYHLFRAKFIRPPQIDYLHDNDIPALLFVRSLEERPSTQFKREYTWHIGNLSFFSPSTGFFAVGRDSPTSIPKRDPKSGDFIDTEDDTSPYTLAVFDASIGLIAIKRETDLASTTEEIASKIVRLFSITKTVLGNQIDVELDPIPDPTGFIAKLDSAYAIKKFTATFTGPNPFDADELFQKPLSVYLNASNGESGSATVEGAHLATDVVIAVARSTAATGNTASARIQEGKGRRSISIHLSGDPIKLPYEDEKIPLQQVLADAQATYIKVRHE